MDFIWKNKGALAVGATLTAFLSNPEPFINGVQHLGSNVATGVGGNIAEHTNWTIVFVSALLLLGIYLTARYFFRQLIRSRSED